MKKTVLVFVGIILVVVVFPLVLVKWKGKRESIRKVEKIEEDLPVRQAAVAGSFYPAGKEVLGQQIDEFLSQASEPLGLEKPPAILIVPHAGYQYSGQVAAYGFKQLIDSGIKRVVILGNSHRAGYSGAAVYPKGFWQTPLGKVEIDTNFGEKIISADEQIFANETLHQQEHSLEVEVPFLQKVLVDFTLIPILLGQTDEKLLKALVSRLAQNITPETLVVISTDLSHYPDYNTAIEVDQKTIEAVLTGKVENFERTIAEQMARNLSGLETCACSQEAVKIGLLLAQKLGEGNWELLNHANSGDLPAGRQGVEMGNKDRVVGYTSIAFYLPDREPANTETLNETETLNKEQQKRLLEIAGQTLESYLKDGEIPEFEVKDPGLNEHLGAFVTLRENGRLRGCIGQFEPNIPLWQVVRQKAVDAAVNDIRFPPVRPEEIEKIEIEISVLSPQKEIDDWREIELGKHGVVVKKGLRSGVFLPQVATENNWDLDTFMGQLCSQKAGLSWDCWKKDDVELYTFTAQVFAE